MAFATDQLNKSNKSNTSSMHPNGENVVNNLYADTWHSQIDFAKTNNNNVCI